ncbi:troponin C [Eurytemora carolleeae]|uniref:troponin C n=1 Tax=Eurytemora carolleeae TaxID=1294199 RepID=UPI000C775959|nr:troponin C [Eurytemora carolleeae]|eukprot:XP_023348679.1 troponin C-like [Eurytemora affinis]
MSAVVESPPVPAKIGVPETKTGDYPTGDAALAPSPAPLPVIEDDMMGELTMDELKEAFRLFDYEGFGYITVETFRTILRELDDDWTEDDISGIISDIDIDGSGTIDFEEFVKIMT